MRYESENGYIGYFTKDNFFGYVHWDLTIKHRDSKGMIYHAEYETEITLQELKEFVDNFPEFLEEIRRLQK